MNKIREQQQQKRDVDEDIVNNNGEFVHIN